MLTLINRASPLELCDSGEYGAAAELAGLRAGERPSRGSQGDSEHAGALLIAGIITSVAGGIQQTTDQTLAREMLTDSVNLFGEDLRADIARYWLAWVEYWDGDFPSALGLIEKVLASSVENKTRFRILLLRVIILSDQGFPARAFEELESMAPLYDDCDPLHKGKYHLDRGRVLRLMGKTDRAIIEYSSAAYFFEEAGDVRGQAKALNNLGGIYLDTGQLTEAHEYAERARRLFRQLGDKTYEAKTWDQTAQIYLAEDKVSEADEAINEGIALVEHGEILNELLAARDKIKHHGGRLTNHNRDTVAPDRSGSSQATSPHDDESVGLTMAPQELARHLIENHPANAKDLYDLLVWATSAREDPEHEAQLDEVEEMLYCKTEDGVKQRNAYRGSRLLRVVPEITSVDS